MKHALALALVCALSGCTITGQSAVERSFSPPDAGGDQWVESEMIVKNRTAAPPFGSKATSMHNFSAGVDEAGNWNWVMGSSGDLEGGELAATLAELRGLIAEVRGILELYHPIGAATILTTNRPAIAPATAVLEELAPP